MVEVAIGKLHFAGSLAYSFFSLRALHHCSPCKRNRLTSARSSLSWDSGAAVISSLKRSHFKKSFLAVNALVNTNWFC